VINKTISVFRKERFSSAHRLYNKNWSDEKNQEVFGLCNNPNFHGHNYVLEVKVTGEIDPDTGYMIDLKILSSIIKEEVLDRFDHKNLNLDVSEFENIIPTAENIAVVIYDKIAKRLAPKAVKIKLYETEKNYVEYPA
jgi:6-pyruvoyltetrahydropterin/6-carboxytetrahydropterin synthase